MSVTVRARPPVQHRIERGKGKFPYKCINTMGSAETAQSKKETDESALKGSFYSYFFKSI